MMFANPKDAYVKDNKCTVCRWDNTTACPLHHDYIGRKLFDEYLSIGRVKICHRFVMTDTEKERRWNLTMQTLNSNL